MSNEGMRVVPAGPVSLYKTYGAASPVASHWRDGTCEEVNCEAWQFGWQTVIDEATDLGQSQAFYIRKHSSRSFTEQRRPDGLTEFSFDGGQACFAKHKVPLERPAIFTVRDGDWRGNPTGRRHVFRSGEDFVDDFGEHQERIIEAIERG
jgi:hypothetical protein